MADDVRVRLSAEGVSEVVNALKQIRDKAKEAGDQGGASFKSLKEAVHEVGAELLGFVAVGAVIEKVRELTAEVFNSAIAIGKLRDATGLSTPNLQAMGQIAQETNVSQETLNRGLEIFTKNVGLAAQGSRQALTGFNSLGISMKELKALSPDQQFQLVAEKLAGVSSESQRAAIGSQIFGRSFLELKPVIDEVANGGLGGVIEQMRKLGVLMDDDVIRQMQQAKKSMNEMGDEAKGLATQFLVGLMPGVTEAMNGIVESTSGGTNGFKMLGQIVGWLVNVVVKGMQVIGTAIGETLGSVTVQIDRNIEVIKSKASLWQKAVALYNLNPGNLAANSVKDGNFDSTKKAAGDFWKSLSEGPQANEQKSEGAKHAETQVQTQIETIGKARLALVNAMLDAELRIFEAKAALKNEAERAAYEQGKIDLATYFADRAQMVNQKVDEEISILKRRRAAIASEKAPISDDGSFALQQQSQLKKLDGEITAKEIERQTQLAQLATQQLQEQRKLHEEQLSSQQKLLTIEGKKADAARIALQLEKEKLALDLQKSGAPPSEVNAAVNEFERQGNAKIDFDEARKDADDTMTALNHQIKSIQDQVKAGVLFPIQGEQQIIALEKQRLPLLEQTASHLEDMARATKDPALVNQADQFRQKVDEIKIATDEAAQHMAALKQTAENALQGGIANALFDIVTHAKSVGDAFRGMAQAFVQALARMEAEYLAKQFIKWLNGEGGSGGGGGGGGGGTDYSGYVQLAAALFAADGGHIQGPGTSTSDSIPAMLSDGEFVVKSSAVSQPGMLQLLHAINGTPGFSRGHASGVQRFASGGQASAGGGGVNIKLINVPDSSLLAQHLESSVGEQQILNIIAKNPSRVRQALG